MARRAALAWVALAMISGGACAPNPGTSSGPIPPATDAREAALVLLQAAQTGRTSRVELEGIVGDDLSGEQWVALANALATLRATTAARILSFEEIGPERTAVDLEVTLAGEGTARYRLQALRDPDETWRVVSLDGPGVAWPAAILPRDEGLSTSAPPPSAAR